MLFEKLILLLHELHRFVLLHPKWYDNGIRGRHLFRTATVAVLPAVSSRTEVRTRVRRQCSEDQPYRDVPRSVAGPDQF